MWFFINNSVGTFQQRTFIFYCFSHTPFCIIPSFYQQLVYFDKKQNFVNYFIENVENPLTLRVRGGTCKHFEHSFEHFFRKVHYTFCIISALSFLPNAFYFSFSAKEILIFLLVIFTKIYHFRFFRHFFRDWIKTPQNTQYKSELMTIFFYKTGGNQFD